MVSIKESNILDLEKILFIHDSAFGKKQGSEILELLKELFVDSDAKPLLSLLAFEREKPIGHILFTNVRFFPEKDISAVILAPFAVLPEFQKNGVGSKIIVSGFNNLKKAGVELVFVLGDPNYYSKFGFEPANKLKISAPLKIPEEHQNAWMVKKLNPISIKNVKVDCAAALKKQKYWAIN